MKNQESFLEKYLKKIFHDKTEIKINHGNGKELTKNNTVKYDDSGNAPVIRRDEAERPSGGDLYFRND